MTGPQSLLLDLPATGPTHLRPGDLVSGLNGRTYEVRRVLWQGSGTDGPCVEATPVTPLGADAPSDTHEHGS